MNKRIEELVEQALENSLFETIEPIVTVGEGENKVTIPLVFAEKFVELIVRECARVDSEMNNPDHVDGKSFNQTILEHFGVK